MLSGVALFCGDPQELMKNQYFRVIFWTAKLREVIDCQKPESRARTANASVESLLHSAIYGERMAGNG